MTVIIGVAAPCDGCRGKRAYVTSQPERARGRATAIPTGSGTRRRAFELVRQRPEEGYHVRGGQQLAEASVDQVDGLEEGDERGAGGCTGRPRPAAAQAATTKSEKASASTKQPVAGAWTVSATA